MMGRPTKYDAAVVARLCHAIRLGATYELACKYAGISYSTFESWRRGEGGIPRPEIPTFLAAINDAEGAAAVGWLSTIEQAAAEGTWQAAAWKLERRYPESYGRTVHDQHVSGADDGPLRVVYEVVPGRPRPTDPEEPA